MLSPEQTHWLRENSAKKEPMDLSSLIAGVPPRQPSPSLARLLGADTPQEIAKATSGESEQPQTVEGSDIGYIRDVSINPRRG